MADSYYKDHKVLIASKHEKEKVIAPVFCEKLGCRVYRSNFDTDQFGTFTGEIPRVNNAYETCILKAKSAALKENYDFSIANEGSFGPHPSIPFVASDHEIMVFVDLKNNWVISEQIITTKTNYNMLKISTNTNLENFLEAVKFPSHSLTLQIYNTKEVIGKGISDLKILKQLLSIGFKQNDELLLGTDMRAMLNPTRMENLSVLAEKLALRILNCCASCGAPGFGFVSTTESLPCSLCESQTSMYRFEVWACIACNYTKKNPRADKLEKANPKYCYSCNP